MTYRLKTGYQDDAVAAGYLDKRFSHPKGKKENEETLLALARSLESIPETRTILDMPCGNGRLTEFFQEGGYLYFGADISFQMMKVLAGARKTRGRTPPLIRCDGEALPFKDGAFDCVVCFRFMNVQRIPKAVRQRILDEMNRVSRTRLILQGKDLKFQGPLIRLKVFFRKLFGKDTAKYEFEKELHAAGWREERRVAIRTINRYIGIYRKASREGPGFE